jgi:hypothetical protein
MLAVDVILQQHKKTKQIRERKIDLFEKDKS